MILALLTATFLLGYSSAIIPNHVGHNIGHDIGQGIDRLGHGIGKIPEDLENIGDTVIDGGLDGLKHAGDLLNPRGKRSPETELQLIPVDTEIFILLNSVKHLLNDKEELCASLTIFNNLIGKLGLGEQYPSQISNVISLLKSLLKNVHLDCENVNVSDKVARAIEETETYREPSN